MARTKKAAKSTDGKAKAEAVKVQKPKAVKKKAAAKTTKQSTPKKGDTQEAQVEATTIVIEACKQCNAFKTRAQKLQTLISEGKPGTTISINPEKPRKGCFEVRNTETGEKYVSLLDMPRPFPPLKALDIDELGDTIVKKL